jgi:hypothetical protein
MHPGDADVSFAPVLDGLGNGISRRAEIEDADANAEDVHTRER